MAFKVCFTLDLGLDLGLVVLLVSVKRSVFNFIEHDNAFFFLGRVW
jgi:hypothetical protein